MTIPVEGMPCVPVIIRSYSNRLFGILHLPSPSAPERHCGVLLLPAGPRYRVGPHRLYVQLARSLAARGFHVLRADTSGVGDSEGEIAGAHIRKVYRMVEDGLFVRDAILWADYFCRLGKVKELILGGLCGGALTSLYVGQEMKEVAGVILLGLPVLLDEPGGAMDRTEASGFLWRYVQRISQVASWSRLLRQESDYRLLLRSFLGFLGFPSGNGPRINPKLVESLAGYLASGRGGICVFGENDAYYSEFRHHLEKRHPRLCASLRQNFESHVIEASDHSFSSSPAKHAMIAAVTNWAERANPPIVGRGCLTRSSAGCARS